MRAAAHHTGQMLTVLRPAGQVQGCYIGSAINNTTGAAEATAATLLDSTVELVPVQLPTGSVRVSLGYLSTFEDVYAFVQFVQDTFADEKAVRLLAEALWELELERPADAYC